MLRVAAIAALVAAAVAPSAGAAPHWRRLATQTRAGSFLVVGAAAQVNGPKALEVKVAAAPHGRVGGNTFVRCGSRAWHGHVHGMAPLVRRLQLPVARPGGCVVVVNVTYAASGRVTLTLLGR